MEYRFVNISSCNMCGSDVSSHKVLGLRLNASQGKNPKNKIGLAVTVCKCKECGLIFSSPQPIPFNIEDHYGLPPESYWKESYFELSDDYFKNEIIKAKQLLDFKPGMKSLDIGAGIGKQMSALKNAGFDTYGFEPSKPFYDRAISKMGISSEKLRHGMLEEMEYPENEFDFISFGAVLEHLYDPAEAIEIAMSWLKPNGIIHIEVPSSNWLTSKILNFYYRLRRSGFVANISPMHSPYHLYEFDIRSFEKNATQKKYSIAHKEFYVCQTFLPSFLDPILKPLMKKTNQGLQLCVWLRKS